MAEPRSFIFIDRLQPRTLSYIATWTRGSLPRSNMAAQIIEVAPGLDIEALYLLECEPASYAILAYNEAEKQANVKAIDYRMIGANGRLYLAGEESEIRSARDAAEAALGALVAA